MEGGIECDMEAGRETQLASVFCSLVRRHDEGTKSRTQCQCVQQGDGYGSCHGQTELGIERTGSSADKAYRNKYSHEDKGGSYQGRGNSIHGVDGGQVRRLVSFIELGLYRLDHHDGIVDHRTNHQYKGKKGQHVEAETYKREKGKSTYQ